MENIFAGGDAYRGASSLIHAIADGQNVANVIITKAKKRESQLYLSK